jgi:hypothetical protein
MDSLHIEDTKTTIQTKKVDFIMYFQLHEITGEIVWSIDGETKIRWFEVLPPEFSDWLFKGFNESRLIKRILKASEREATL